MIARSASAGQRTAADVHTIMLGICNQGKDIAEDKMMAPAIAEAA